MKRLLGFSIVICCCAALSTVDGAVEKYLVTRSGEYVKVKSVKFGRVRASRSCSGMSRRGFAVRSAVSCSGRSKVRLYSRVRSRTSRSRAGCPVGGCP